MSLFRAKLNDARSPVNNGLSNLVPTDQVSSSCAGNNIAIENGGPVQIFTSGDQQVWAMTARHLSGQCVIGREGSSTVSHYYMINDAITQVWASSTANTSSTPGVPGGAAVDASGTYVYVCQDGTNGTTGGGTNGRVSWAKLAVSDGSEEWFTGSGATAYEFPSTTGLDLAESDGDLYTPTDRLQTVAMYAVALATGVGRATFSREGLSLPSSLCVSPDDEWLCVLTGGTPPEIARYSLPASQGVNFDGYPGNELLLDGTDTVNDFGNSGPQYYNGNIVSGRVDGENYCYFVTGRNAAGTWNTPYLGRLDPDGGTYGAIDKEVNAVADSDLTSGTTDMAVDCEVDRCGNVYVLCIVDDTSWDIVRYKPDLTEPFSFSRDGGVSMPAIATYGIPTRLVIDDADSVFVGSRTGYVTRFSQS